MNTKYEIQLCKTCDGKGVIEEHECTNYHKHEYDVHFRDCKTCEGTGRLQVKTVVVAEPFKIIKPTK